MKKSRTTITEIAKELGISPSTVSRALNNHPAISKKTKRAVVKLAKKLNYQPNLLALNLLNKKTNTIGVIVPEITSYFFSSIINGIQDMVNPLGINMIIGQSNESYEAEKNIVQTFASIRVDGFLISPASETKIFDHFEILVNNNIPLV
ncbi:MAG: LacI family DNA-binding transcriptional regulator, partial [Prolixibacteraceae bacterium]|nr:LacI family DNA-binding transcriptional regulator [Prolixibacteraceae bacterium]